MARPRGSMALFDLLDRGGSTPNGAPQASDRSREVGGTVGMRTDAVASDRPLVMGRSRVDGRRRSAESGGTTSRTARRPFVEVQDDFVCVALTSVRTAIVVFAALALLLAAFEIGRRRGDGSGFTRGYHAGRESYTADTMGELEAARSGPVSSGVVADLAVGGSATLDAYQEAVGVAPRLTKGDSAWIAGHTYVVAQGFAAGRDADATRAQSFLASRGIETVLVRFESGVMQLISARGFNRTDAAQRALSDRLLEEVRSAGADYFASGGGYKLEGYFATFKGGRW